MGILRRDENIRRNKVIGLDSNIVMEGDDPDLEGNVSDDDELGEEDEDPWFSSP